HQIATVRGGAPVDATTRVAGGVRAWDEVVGALAEPGRAGLRGAAGRADLGGQWDQRDGLRDDGDGARIAERLLALDEPERIRGAQQQWPERADAAANPLQV